MPTKTTTTTSTPTTVPSAIDVPSLAFTDENGCPIAKGGVACPFPWRLHECLDAVERDGLEHICSWQSHGRSFTVYKPREFEKVVMPRFFGQTRYASFQRQLNIYGFRRFQQGRDKGAYYHLAFVRGNRNLVRTMKRTKIKGVKGMKTALNHSEPDLDFYHPAWENHSEPSIPQALTTEEKETETPPVRVSSPVVSNPTPASSGAIPVVSSQGNSQVGSNILIPFSNPADLAAMLMNSSLQSSQMGIWASFQPVLLAGNPAPAAQVLLDKPTCAPVDPANVSTVSDDHSDGLSSKEENSNPSAEDIPDDFSILSFAKNLFEDDAVACNNAPPSTTSVTAWEDLLDPTPVREPCQCCGGTGMKLVDPTKNLYAL